MSGFEGIRQKLHHEAHNAKVKDEKVVLSDLQEPSNYEGIDMITEIEDDEGIHVALHYPQFESEILNEEIDAIVKEQHHLFTEALSVSEYVFTKDSPALLNLSFEIYPLERTYIRLCLVKKCSREENLPRNRA